MGPAVCRLRTIASLGYGDDLIRCRVEWIARHRIIRRIAVHIQFDILIYISPLHFGSLFGVGLSNTTTTKTRTKHLVFEFFFFPSNQTRWLSLAMSHRSFLHNWILIRLQNDRQGGVSWCLTWISWELPSLCRFLIRPGTWVIRAKNSTPIRNSCALTFLDGFTRIPINRSIRWEIVVEIPKNGSITAELAIGKVDQSERFSRKNQRKKNEKILMNHLDLIRQKAWMKAKFSNELLNGMFRPKNEINNFNRFHHQTALRHLIVKSDSKKQPWMKRSTETPIDLMTNIDACNWKRQQSETKQMPANPPQMDRLTCRWVWKPFGMSCALQPRAGGRWL